MFFKKKKSQCQENSSNFKKLQCTSHLEISELKKPWQIIQIKS
jgi:hypothetical protein